MSAAAPDPFRLVALAALGVGVYWFMSRRAAAAPAAASGAVVSPYRVNNTANLVAQTVGTIASLFNGGKAAGTVDGRSSQQWDTTPSYGQPGTAYNNPSAYTALASSQVDGLAYNPVGGSSYDSAAYSMDGSDGAWWN